MMLPQGEATPRIRTDFCDDDAWSQAVEAATATSPEGFRAVLQIVDDRAFEGADAERLAELAETTTEHVLLVIADRLTMTDPERSLLCIDPLPPGGSFRTVPEQLWGVENNVSLANMDFAEFAAATDQNGVFRGFPA